MKLTSVEIHPDGSSNVAVLSFRDPRGANPYIVKSILGLDAEDITAQYYTSPTMSKFYNLSLKARVIVAKIGLNPAFSQNMSYSDLRDELYRAISSSRTGHVQIQFKNGPDVVAAISGFISKFETPHFEKAQEIQLTIQCDEPMLKSMVRYDMPLDSVDPQFTVIQDLRSTAPHGYIFELNVLIPTPFVTIFDTSLLSSDDNWSFIVTPDGGFLPGDLLHVSSEYNNKELYVIRGTDTIYLADKLEPGSIWPIIFPGDNHLSVFGQDLGTDYFSWRSIEYYLTYWGV